MPLYEYQCESCGRRFELIQKFSDPPAEVCPSCGGAVRKLLSSPAIQFKGSGWYITDYAQKGKASETKSDTSTETAKSSPASESSSSGPAASTPAGSSSKQSSPR